MDPPPADEVVDDEDLFEHVLFPKHEKKTFVDITQEMKMKSEELSILPGNMAKLPSMIWLDVNSSSAKDGHDRPHIN